MPGQLIHNQFNFSQGTYVSPLTSSQIQFSGAIVNPIVSQYDVHVGLQGEGVFPSDGSTVAIASTRIGDDTYTPVAPPDQLSYLRSTTLYNNTASEISNLLVAASQVTPLTSTPTSIDGSFTMPCRNG